MHWATGFLFGMTFGLVLASTGFARVRALLEKLVRAGTLRYEPRAGEPASADELIHALDLAGRSRSRTILVWTVLILTFLGIWLGLTLNGR